MANQPNNAVLEQAAEWYAMLRSGQASEQQQAAWQQWLETSQEHRIAWEYVEQISHRFTALQQTPDPKRTIDTLQQANTRLQQRRRLLSSLLALTSLGTLGWLSWRYTPLPTMLAALQADHQTGTGEQMELTLPDGSLVWLNTGTAIKLEFDVRLRRVELIAGEIFINTATDSRPFVVDTEHGRLRALGTRFNVYQQEAGALLGVYEGAVEVHSKNGLQQIVQMGLQARLTAQQISAMQPVDIAREAWRRGILVAEDISLGELVAELRRYHWGHIGLAEDIEELRVYGNFPLRDTEQMFTMLASVLPIQVNQTLPWWVSIESR